MLMPTPSATAMMRMAAKSRATARLRSSDVINRTLAAVESVTTSGYRDGKLSVPPTML